MTGAARDLVELDTAAPQFGRGADWFVVRADSASTGAVRDDRALREIAVPDLPRLQELMARGMR